MMRAKWKEAALLLLPVAAMMCVALWWQQKEKRDAVLESGPLRLEVEKIEKVTPTPAEVAEGYDTKYVVSFAYRGRDPLAFYRQPDSDMYPFSDAFDAKLLERANKKWQEISRKETSPRVLVAGDQFVRQLQNNQIAVLLPLSQLPKKDLRVQFSALLRLSYLVPKGSVKPQGRDVWVQPAPNKKNSDDVTVTLRLPVVSVPVRKAGEPAPVPEVSRYCPLELKEARVIRWTPAHAMVMDGRSGADTRLEIKVQKDSASGEQAIHRQWKYLDVHIVDETGKKYTNWRSKYQGRWGSAFDFNGGSHIPTPTGEAKDGIYTHKSQFALSQIPLSAGQLTLKAKISVDEAWPLPISVVVRKRQSEDWTLRKAKTLSLKSIDVEPDLVDNLKFDVYVRVNYNGPHELIERPKIGQRAYGDFYYADNPNFYTYGLDYVYLNKEIRTPNRRLLVTNWSQRLEDGGKAESNGAILLAPNRQIPVQVTHVVYGIHYLIIYKIDLSKLKTRPKNLMFKADIGVEDDGFLPVSVALPVATNKKPDKKKVAPPLPQVPSPLTTEQVDKLFSPLHSAQ